MPGLLEHSDLAFIKLMLIGNSGTGKTGSLASLVAAGYKLRILDLENKLDVLVNYLTDERSPYFQRVHGIDLNEAVRYKVITEPMKTINGRPVPAKASVWQNTMNMLSDWKEEEHNLGKPSSWGPDTILVIDSFSALSEAALNFVQAMGGHLGGDPAGNEWRRDVGVTQSLLERVLLMLCEKDFQCHVIIITHITYVGESGNVPVALTQESAANAAMSVKGFPTAIGRALSPRIPRRFNNILQTEVSGSGQGTRRKIYTTPQNGVDVKSSAPMRLKPDYPLESGLAEIFKALRGGKEPIPQVWGGKQ